ncbi:MAG: Aldo/keto reductase [Ilumatobacteraceae bacterium]|nr:Aldo/keto reductase [Ilumatobacteraceae bacterium]
MIDVQPFGSTGHLSTRVVFGAAALGGMSQSRADATLGVMRAAGVNHIDTAASYGESEVRLQPFLADHRADYFLATKTDARTGDAARRELERSLTRLGVDHVDLIQLHNLVEPDELEVAHGPGGAVDALIAARDEGLVRFIGVTGHGTRIPDMHLRSLDRFRFDSVLLPYNVTMMRSAAYAASFEALAARCAADGIAVQTIKSVARRRWPDESTDPHYAWYEPLPEGDALRRGVAFVLNRPGIFLNTSSDARLLPAILDAAASGLAMPTDDELDADIADYGMTPLFDGGALERI